jgi:hypothetical protein
MGRHGRGRNTSQCRQGFYCFFCFHILTIKEITKYDKRAGDFLPQTAKGMKIAQL